MRNRVLTLALAVFLTTLAADHSAGQQPGGKAPRRANETFTDPAKAGPDYQIQGEYVGESPGHPKFGAQVVAEGDGKFFMRALRGGLPGDGWDGERQHRFTVKTENGKTT